MATRLARKYDYSFNSDTDASSDYSFDLTAEQEDLLETLVAGASSKPSVAAAQSSGLGGAIGITGAPSLRSDIAAVFATHASVKSLHDSEVNLDVRESRRDPGFAYRDEPSVLSGLAASRAIPPPDADDDDDDDVLAALVDEEERRAPIPVKVGDIRYPDCE